MARRDEFTGSTFTVVENKVIMDERVSSHGLLVYVALRHHLNQQTGQCNPGWARIAKIARCSRRKVATAIAELEALGCLRRTANPGHSNAYELLPVHPVHTTRAGGAPPPVQVVHTEQYEEEQDEENKKPSPKKETAAEPPAVAEPSLHRAIQLAFEAKHGTFVDYPKEGSAIKGLIKKAEKLFPDDPPAFIKKTLEEFWRLKSNGNTFWNGQPFLPSALNASGIFERVVEGMRAPQEVSPEMDAVVSRIKWGRT